MTITLAALKPGEKALIKEVSTEFVPLKLLEMGCLPGNPVELVKIATFSDPLYLNINGSYVAIRKETASHITIQLKPNE